jgi:hypothetical protein
VNFGDHDFGIKIVVVNALVNAKTLQYQYQSFTLTVT